MLRMLKRLNSCLDPSPEKLDQKMAARPRHMTFGEFVEHCLNR